jgi:hypothetical protein
MCVCQVSPLFLWSAWAHSLWWLADIQGRLSQSLLCSIGRRGLSHCGDGSIGKGVFLVSPVFLGSSWAESLW